MDFDASQRTAVDAAVAGLDEGTHKLNGPAGTGKTTVIREVLDRVKAAPVVLAPTNKACHVLRGKGVPAVTIHSAIYAARSTQIREEMRALTEAIRGESDAREVDEMRARLEALRVELASQPSGERLSFAWQALNSVNGQAVIVDEASMVGRKVFDDLRRSTDRGIVLVGDDAQLAPVRDEAVFHDMEAAASLTTVHRHAGDQPILDIATAVRERNMLTARTIAQNAGCVVSLHDAPIRHNAAEHVEICWRNKTRHDRNRLHRQAHGRTRWLEKGDWLISLETRDPEFNGSIVQVLPSERGVWGWKKVRGQPSLRAPVVHLLVDSKDVIRRPVPVECLAGPTTLAQGGWDFAYAITAHKAQGSEWDSVTVYDDWSWADHDAAYQEQRRRWLYTAITRARRELVWATA